jgi:hypothetical protein
MLGSVCHAQAQSTGGGKQLTSLEFSCVALSKFKSPPLFYFVSGEYKPLQVPVGAHSPEYKLSNAAVLKLYVERKDEQGDVSYVQCAEAPLMMDCKRMLFIVSRTKDKSPWPLQLLGMDDSLETFPTGSFRFMNATRVPLEVSINGKRDKIAPRAIAIIAPDVSETGGFYPFTIDGPDGSRFYETKLYGQFHGRETVLIGPPAHDPKRLTIKFLSQVIPPR